MPRTRRSRIFTLRLVSLSSFMTWRGGNRKHNIHADRDTTARALETLMDKANHPVLLHCKKGKHRTGCIIGVLRKQRGWAFSSIFTEYCGFEPQAKSREEDERFIEDFELESYIATNGVIS